VSDGGEVLLCDLEPTLGVLEGGRQGPTSGMEEPLMPDAGFRQGKIAGLLFVPRGVWVGSSLPWSVGPAGFVCCLNVYSVVITLSTSSQVTDRQSGVLVTIRFIDV
jgi:hypothetical protein